MMSNDSPFPSFPQDNAAAGQTAPVNHGSAASPPVERLQFTGSGGEYFRIWIVNLVLTILTLGIYSAWAKVRTLRYLYNHTHFANSNFDFHGKPLAILIGRVIGVILLGLTMIPLIGPVFWLLFLLLMPWLLNRSMKFRLSNTSYRNLRFSFDGSVGGAFSAIFLPILIVVLAIGLSFIIAEHVSVWLGITLMIFSVLAAYVIGPYIQFRWRRYLTNNAFAGAQPFSFRGTAGGYYLVYLVAVGLWIAVGAVASAVLAAFFSTDLMQFSMTQKLPAFSVKHVIGAFIIAAIYFLLIAVGGVIVAMLHNLVWNKTDLAGASLKADLDVPRYAMTWMVCTLLTLLTLGLYRPFAVVKLARMRVEATGWTGGPEQLLAVLKSPNKRAIGEEVADILGFDIGG